jgi:hypothetical protein
MTSRFLKAPRLRATFSIIFAVLVSVALMAPSPAQAAPAQVTRVSATYDLAGTTSACPVEESMQLTSARVTITGTTVINDNRFQFSGSVHWVDVTGVGSLGEYRLTGAGNSVVTGSFDEGAAYVEAGALSNVTLHYYNPETATWQTYVVRYNITYVVTRDGQVRVDSVVADPAQCF